MGTWRLAGFENACKVGDPACLGFRQFAAPELLFAEQKQEPYPADARIDMWGIGRVLHHLIMPSDFWPVAYRRRDERFQYLLHTYTPLFNANELGLPQTAAEILTSLLTKDPVNRGPLDQFHACYILQWSMLIFVELAENLWARTLNDVHCSGRYMY